jgi:hypothetical protein
MAFNGTEGGIITLADGSAMTAAYRKQKKRTDKNGHFFGRDILQNILDQEGCVGIRMYYGLREDKKDDMTQELIIVGTDRDENDILDIIGDISVPCPNMCGKANPLNS